MRPQKSLKKAKKCSKTVKNDQNMPKYAK